MKVHVDCVNANSLVTEDESIDKEDSKNIVPKSQDPTQQGTVSSNESTATENVKVIDNETDNENYPLYLVSDIVGKSWYSFAKLGVDILSVSSRLSSMYYEQCLQYEKMWSYYWTETYKSFNAFLSQK